MTDFQPSENQSPLSSRPPPSPLRTFRTQISHLQYAARSCKDNYEHYGDREPLPLLDFDLICGSLRTLEVPEIATLARAEERGLQDVLHAGTSALRPLLDMSGPHTMRHILSSIEHYAIPPGAHYELLKRKRDLNQTLSIQARTLLDRFKAALVSPDPVATLVGHKQVRDLRQVVESELHSLDALHDDARLLESVIARSAPLEELLGDRPKESVPAYRFTLDLLKNRREQRAFNNALDALNVAVLVWMVNSPKFQANKYVPILISQTRAIIDLGSHQEALSLHPPGHGQVRWFNTLTYLVLSLSLARAAQGRSRLITVKAAALEHELGCILQAINLVIESINQGLVAPDDYDAPEWQLLHLALLKLQDNWDYLLRPLFRFRELDRTSYRNLFVTPGVTDLVSKLNPEVGAGEVKRQLKWLRYRLLEAGREDREMWRVLLTDSVQELTSRGNLEAISSLFKITVCSNTIAVGRLLCLARPGVAFSPGEVPSLMERSSFRIVVRSRYLGRLESGLVIDVWRAQDGHRIAFMWGHDGDVLTVSDAISHATMALGPRAEACELSLFGETLSVSQQSPLALKACLEEELATLAWHCLEVSTDQYVLFSDLEPTAGMERQGGVVGSLERWDEAGTRAMKSLLEKTTALSAGSVAQYGRMLDNIVSSLRLHPTKGAVHG